MFGASPFGSVPFGSGPVTYTELSLVIESADWTGIEQRLAVSSEAVEDIQSKARELELAIEAAGLTNVETAKAKALIGAIIKLVESPEPEWRVIARLLVTFLDSKPVKAAINAVTIGGLAVGILKLITG